MVVSLDYISCFVLSWIVFLSSICTLYLIFLPTITTFTMAHHDSTHNNLRNSSSPSDSDEPSWRQEKKLDQEAQHFESAPPVDGEHTNETDPRITRFTPAEQRKIIHKVDRRLTVTLGVLYCISLMDRTNLSAANIAG